MSVDYPRAWEIARASRAEDHDPRCSYRTEDGGFLCDCHVLTAHPEYLADGVLYTRGGVPWTPERNTP